MEVSFGYVLRHRHFCGIHDHRHVVVIVIRQDLAFQYRRFVGPHWLHDIGRVAGAGHWLKRQFDVQRRGSGKAEVLGKIGARAFQKTRADDEVGIQSEIFCRWRVVSQVEIDFQVLGFGSC